MIRICVGTVLVLLVVASSPAQPPESDPLMYTFSGGYGQVEVGGRYAGAEFHDSRPLPSRISFYYPVANSIDLSTDYWKRGDSHPMVAGVRVDSGPSQLIGKVPWEYILSPHKVTFARSEDGLDYSMTYEFGLQEPFMAYRLTVKNAGTISRHVEAYVHLKTALRTCQTYTRFDSAWVSYDSAAMTSIARFPEPQTSAASVIVQNVGQPPSGRILDAEALAVNDTGASSWKGFDAAQWSTGSDGGRRRSAIAAFTYSKKIQPGDSLVIGLLIASCTNDEASTRIQKWARVWQSDVDAYERYIRERSIHGATIRTGDPWVDRSIRWANALLAANAHFLDGAVVPMPCPAEYNFFFTHDVLLTDLAAISFDPTRVRRDLSYIADHARDSVIPHAYYWKDDGFKTEYCPPDDWNHLWFVLAAGTYLRHTLDTAFSARLYPITKKSMAQALLRLKSDHLMHALAPDWWDIGKHEGSRAYMTILIIRAIREYLFVSSFLGKDSPELLTYEHLADEAQTALGTKLWDQQSAYLTNYNGSIRDTHYYMGSLLAPVFHLLDLDRSRLLVRTAERELLARDIGIRTVMPPDFNTDSMLTFFHFAGNEACDPYLYANGGVWAHSNAWYTLALRATGRVDDAYNFFRTAMTLDGVAHSPMGQPAMYEYRYSDPKSPRYGWIDKPTFLWAAGFTLLTAYQLVGIDDNEWNISFSGDLPLAWDSVACSLEFFGAKHIRRVRQPKGFQQLTVDGALVPSVVVPVDVASSSSWVLQSVGRVVPQLESINAILRAVAISKDAKKLTIVASSFTGHVVSASINSQKRPLSVTVNGKPVKTFSVSHAKNGSFRTLVRYTASEPTQGMTIRF